MTTLIRNIIIILVFIGLLTLSVKEIVSLKKELKTKERNIESLIANSSIQQELTQNEYKKYYALREDSIIKKYKISRKKIKEVIVTKYNIKDSTIINFNTKEVLIYGKEDFRVNKGCFTISGGISNNVISFKEVSNNDELTYILHRKATKKFLFIKWAYQNQGLMYSKCKGDTIPITLNLKIE